MPGGYLMPGANLRSAGGLEATASEETERTITGATLYGGSINSSYSSAQSIARPIRSRSPAPKVSKISEFSRLDYNKGRRVTFLTTQLEETPGTFKIISYDFQRLIDFSATLTLLVRGTIFRLDRTISIAIFGYACVFIGAAAGVYFLEDPNSHVRVLAPLEEIDDSLRKFGPFLFGLFTSIILTRWWTLRTDGIGALADVTINISGLLVSCGARILRDPGDWGVFKQIHSKVVKYGVASMSCIVKESREKMGDYYNHAHHSFEGLLSDGFLDPAEIELLENKTCHAYILWCWVQALSLEAFEMMKIPGPNHNMVFQEVRTAMQGIHIINQYIHTQLPFPYVHMITFIVNAHNIVLCIVAGIEVGLAASQNHKTKASIGLTKALVLPILYQGLLQICVALSDPMGDDLIDFPVRQFQLEVSEACEDHLSCRALFEAFWLERTHPLPNALVIERLPRNHEFTPAASLLAVPQDKSGPQVFMKLDQRLNELLESSNKLAANMALLQEELLNNDAGWWASVQNLQLQIRGLLAHIPNVLSPLLRSRWAQVMPTNYKALGSNKIPTIPPAPPAALMASDAQF